MRTIPDTSVAAYEASAEFAPSHDEKIVNIMRDARRPMAPEEIADVGGFTSHVQVNRRMAVLVSKGLVSRTTELHTNRSGRKAYRYAVAAKRE